jgi:hypothetical protein
MFRTDERVTKLPKLHGLSPCNEPLKRNEILTNVTTWMNFKNYAK